MPAAIKTDTRRSEENRIIPLLSPMSFRLAVINWLVSELNAGQECGHHIPTYTRIRVLYLYRKRDPDPFDRGRRRRVTEIGTRDVVISKELTGCCGLDVGDQTITVASDNDRTRARRSRSCEFVTYVFAGFRICTVAIAIEIHLHMNHSAGGSINAVANRISIVIGIVHGPPL